MKRWAAPGRRLLNLYGPAEAAIWSSWYECTGDDVHGGDEPIGLPIVGKKIYILDDRRRMVPAGQEGELYIGGVGLGRYLGRPDLMAEAFVRDPFSGQPGDLLYRAGDICVSQPDGVIEYRGRRDRQVKIHGQRVELYEVERILEKASGVDCCQVFERDGRLEAVVVVKPGQWQEMEVRAYLRRYLHSGMIPSRFRIANHIALSDTGKFASVSDPDSGSAREAEVSRVTWQICQLYSSCLRIGLGEVKLDTDFFSVGGDSLAIAELLTALEAQFGIVVEVEQLLADPSLNGVARLVIESRGS